MFFQFPLEQVTEVIVTAERIPNNQIGKFGTLAENKFFFLNFQVPIKILNFF